MERNIWNAGDRSLSFLFRSTPERKETEDLTRQRIWQNGSVVSAGYPGGRMWYEKYEIQDRKRNSMPQNGGKILKNAYQVTADITGLSVLVVDDVYTTGSTMDAMAQCLLEAGAKEVYFLTVCAGRA